MIINWVAAKAQQFLLAQDAGLDELSVNFDFALSAEVMSLLHAQNEAGQQAEPAKDASTAIRIALDEHELALV